MNTRALIKRLSVFLFASGLICAAEMNATAQEPAQMPDARKAQSANDYGRIPLSFEANQGQADKSAKFVSRGAGYGLLLTRQDALLSLRKPLSAQPFKGPQTVPQRASCDVIRMQLAGANAAAEVTGVDRLPGTANYFIGKDPENWHTDIPTYAKVRYSGVYPGIDLVYYGNQQQLEYDFIVAPHASPKPIRIRFAGAADLALTPAGDLAVATQGGQVVFQAPAIYQEIDGRRQTIAGRFLLDADNTVTFMLGEYDRSHSLIIDPILVYSTYLGGSGGDAGVAVAVDSSGSAYVTGSTNSTDFPVTAGALQTASPSRGAVFVTKFSPDGSSLIYSTYFGGAGGETVSGIAIDSNGNAYITGTTSDANFPTTAGAFQTTNNDIGGGSAFVTEINATGTALVYSTYLGGSGGTVSLWYAGGPVAMGDSASGIAVDADGDAYVAGTTISTDFPVTSGAFQTVNAAAVLSQGTNGFVTKLNPAGTALLYSTFLGGTGATLVQGQGLDATGDGISSIALDSTGNAYLTGFTQGSFPVTSGAFQTTYPGTSYDFENTGTYVTTQSSFVTKLNAAGTQLVYSTYLGGSGEPPPSELTTYSLLGDQGNGIAVDSSGDAYVIGYSYSSNFPTTAGVYQPGSNDPYDINGGGDANVFVSKLNPSGTGLVYSTFVNNGDGAGSGNLIAIDAAGNAYTAGAFYPGTFFTGYPPGPSIGFPVTATALQSSPNASNSLIVKINPTGTALLYSSYIGGSGSTLVAGIQVDSSENLYVTGTTNSANFPVSSNPYQSTNKGTGSTAYLSKFALGDANTPTPLYGTNLNMSTSPPTQYYTPTQVYGSPVTFIENVANNIGKPPVPSGNVVVYVDGSAFPPITLDNTGMSTLTNSSLASGTHIVTGTYLGNTGFAASELGENTAVFTENFAPGAFALLINPAAPTFTPAGGTYAPQQRVSISDAEAAATIQYSTDGGTTWLAYSGPITLASTTTLTAQAVSADTTTTSSTSSAAYTLLPAAATPTFSPAAGSYAGMTSVAISDATAGATIYYTTDGVTTPTISSTKYTGAITVQSTETILAIAAASGNSNSAIASATYTITPDFTFAASPTSLTVKHGQGGTVTLTVTPEAGFNAAVSFSCSGLPAGASCSFLPATVTPAGAPATTTLTISTSTSTAALNPGANGRQLLPASALALVLLGFGWKARRRWQIFCLLAVSLIGLGILTSCGGSRKPVTSTVTVGATAGSISQTEPITLTVN
jgi:hypothetical protein